MHFGLLLDIRRTPRKTQPSCVDGRPYDASPLWHSFCMPPDFAPEARSVVRLRSINSTAERHAADFALARTQDEFRVR